MYGYRVWFKIHQDQPFFSCEISDYSKNKFFYKNPCFLKNKMLKK
jgi:hypothetical protein